ncbi:hypothetical protein HDE_08507 [Halotydeus destructor]|nr:hypothetical protein HDE_08507 [Halotydeus destructor]
MIPVKRPRPVKEEDDEDLMRLQEEFLAKKQAPSTTVVKDETERTAAAGVEEETEQKLADNHDIPNLFDLNIVEKTFNKSAFVAPPKATPFGFPKPRKRNVDPFSTFKANPVNVPLFATVKSSENQLC